MLIDPKLLLFQPRWRDIFAGFYTIFWFKPNILIFVPKFRQKYLSTVNKITLSPKEIARSPGWHMKDNRHTSLFCPMFVFDKKYNFGARLEQVRSKNILTAKKIFLPLTIFLALLPKTIFFDRKEEKKGYWCYYPHWLRDSVSPVCEFFLIKCYIFTVLKNF